jgi:hypothetical protein
MLVCLLLMTALSAPACMKMPDENAVDPPELIRIVSSA